MMDSDYRFAGGVWRTRQHVQHLVPPAADAPVTTEVEARERDWEREAQHWSADEA